MVKVLIVDDEVDVVEFLNNFFRRKGFKPFKATDAKKALEIFYQESPELVFLDIQMRQQDDGFFVLKKIKEIAPHTKVIMLTGRDDKSSIIRAKKMGAENYLVKPIDLEAFEDIISQYAKCINNDY